MSCFHPFLNAKSGFECLLTIPNMGKGAEIRRGGTLAWQRVWRCLLLRGTAGQGRDAGAGPWSVPYCPLQADVGSAVPLRSPGQLRFQGDSWPISFPITPFQFFFPFTLYSQTNYPVLSYASILTHWMFFQTFIYANVTGKGYRDVLRVYACHLQNE